MRAPRSGWSVYDSGCEFLLMRDLLFLVIPCIRSIRALFVRLGPNIFERREKKKSEKWKVKKRKGIEVRKSRDGVSGTEPIRAVAESKEGRMQQGWRRGIRRGEQPTLLLTALFSLCAFNFERANHLSMRSLANICSSYICPLYNSNRYDIYRRAIILILYNP